MLSQLIRLATEDVNEDIKLPINIGDTVRMGKFKNKKVVIKTMDWNEKGDLLVYGRYVEVIDYGSVADAFNANTHFAIDFGGHI